MSNDEEVEEECISVLGWSLEQVARSSLPEMYEALHQRRSATVPSSSSLTLSLSKEIGEDGTTPRNNSREPIHPRDHYPPVLSRLLCLQQRITVQKRLLQSGQCDTEDTEKFTRRLEEDYRLFEEDHTAVTKRLELLERIVTKKSQTLAILDDLVKMTDQVKGLHGCVSHDMQHRKEVTENLHDLQMERNSLLEFRM